MSGWTAADYAVTCGAFGALGLLFVIVWRRLGLIGVAQYAIILASTCAALWLYHVAPNGKTTFGENESNTGDWFLTFLTVGFFFGTGLAYLLTVTLPRYIRSRQQPADD